jgi:osmotically-inducible protein OsmY
MRERKAHRRPEDTWQDDATLAHKVESEVLGDRAIDKGRLNVNAEHGIVILRGAVDTPDDMERLERRVAAVPGVMGVRSLLHLKNAPAHSKDASRKASEQATSEVGSQARSF